MKLPNKSLSWFAIVFCATCWAYALVARFTGFFMAPRLEKVTLFGAALAGCGLLSLMIFFGLFPNGASNFHPRSLFKTIFPSALAALTLLLFIIPPFYFPENHLLEIFPISPSEEGNLTILSIQRVELPGGAQKPIYPTQMVLQGSWQVDSDSDILTLNSEPATGLTFAQLMQAGVMIKFKTGPRQSQARIVWDGQEFTLNLSVPADSTLSFELKPALNLQRANLTHKVLVGFAKIAEFLGLCAILTIALHLSQTLTLRNFRTILAGAAVLLILIPLVNFADPSVQFQDPQLEAAVREFLEQPDGMIRQHKLLTIAWLDASERGIMDLEGIQTMRNLASLDLSNNRITDITRVSKLNHLRELNLQGNSVSDATPLTKLTKLESLNLRENPIADLTSLSQLINLRELDLRGDQIKNLTPIANLINLKSLNLRENPISDIAIISNFTHLRELNLRGILISDIAPITELIHLEHLDLRDNSINDISLLKHIPHLRELDLRGNSVSNITALAALVNLRSLDLESNPVSDLTPLRKLTDLVKLNLTNIPLGENISLLRDFTSLNHLSIRNCAVNDISTLSRLMTQGALQDNPVYSIRAFVDIRDNPIHRDSVDGYASLRPFWKNITERIPFVLPAYNTLEAPTFSHNGGFYEDAFWLMLSTQDPQAEIYYTLDGSEPAQDSTRYRQPIKIQSRAGKPNLLSAISTTSPRWIEPLGEVLKATVVSVKAFGPDGSSSETATHTYFIGKDLADHFSLPIVSLTTDPEYFFDYDQGIYVMGRIWDEENDHELNTWQKQAANYHQRGSLWERPIHVEFFDSFGKRELAQNGGVRIHGNWTRSFRQKTLRLYADDWYDRSDYFEYEFFPGLHDAVEGETIADFKSLLLRNSGNDWDYNMFADAMIQTLVSQTNLDTQSYRPVIVFLNGEYWGIHNLRERLDEYYLAAHYRVDPDQVVILEKTGVLAVGEPGDEAPYQALLDFIGTHEVADPQVYSYIATQMDIENFIDYQITEIFIRNTDWPHTNIKFWRYKTDSYQPDTPYGQDGRWRWMLYDTEQGFGLLKEEPESYKLNTLENVLNQTGISATLLPSLIKNPDFRVQFINRFADQLNTTFAPQRVSGVIDEMQAVIAPEMPEHIRRWRTMNDSMEVWQENVDRMRTFAYERPEYMRRHIVDTFGLSGTAAITLVTDISKGHIRINSLDVTSDTPDIVDAGNWSGIYFKGVPVSITAIPEPGYFFAGWEGIDQVDPNLHLILENDLILTANFIPVEN